MAKIIETPARCSHRNKTDICRHTGCLCSPSISTFVKNCPLADAPDPEKYRRAIELLKRVPDLLDREYQAEDCNDLDADITEFLAGEDGG